MIDETALRAARRARADVVSKRSTGDLIGALAEAATVLAAPDTARRRETAQALYAALSLSPAMIDHGLDLIFGAVTADTLHDLVAAQVADPADLDRARTDADGSTRHFVGPEIIYHSLAGNIPGLAVPALVCGVLARSVTLIRDSSRQPILSRAFRDTLARIDPLVGALVVAIDSNISAADARRVLADADAVVELHGSNAVVARQAQAFSGIATTQHGSRASAVIATSDAAASQWVERIAHDVVMYEGLGCLTPHTLIVEGDGCGVSTAVVSSWCHELGLALDAFERRWPRCRQSVALETARRSFLEHAEVSSLLGGNTPSVRGHEDCWCITTAAVATASLGPGMRCITVLACADREATVTALATMPVAVAGLGLTLDMDTPNGRLQAAEIRRRTGATLVCAAGSMQAPPPSWEQDGGRRLGDLLDWRAVPA